MEGMMCKHGEGPCLRFYCGGGEATRKKSVSFGDAFFIYQDCYQKLILKPNWLVQRGLKIGAALLELILAKD